MKGKEKLRVEESGGGGKEPQETQISTEDVMKKAVMLEAIINRVIEVVNVSNQTVNKHSEQLSSLMAIFTQINDELSKLTGELHRSLEANEKVHRYILAAIAEIPGNIPAIVDNRIKDYIELDEEQTPDVPPEEEVKKED